MSNIRDRNFYKITVLLDTVLIETIDMMSKPKALTKLALIWIYLASLIPVLSWAESPLNQLQKSYPLELWFLLWLASISIGVCNAVVIDGPMDKHINRSGGSLAVPKLIMSLFVGLLGSLIIADLKHWPIPSLQLVIWGGVLAGVGPTIILTLTELLPSAIRKRLGLTAGEAPNV